MRVEGQNNEVRVGSGIKLEGEIVGDDNIVDIADADRDSDLIISIHGHRNRVQIGRIFQVKGVRIRIGTHIPANEASMLVGEGFSAEWGTQFLLHNSGNTLTIGDRCMFSNSITVRCGESPHLIFDVETGRYLDDSTKTVIGSHVWVGEGVYVTKRAIIPNEAIIGAHSVVTASFDEEFVVIAGNPARVVRRGVRWIRNPSLLHEGTREHAEYCAYVKRYAGSDDLA